MKQTEKYSGVFGVRFFSSFHPSGSGRQKTLPPSKFILLTILVEFLGQNNCTDRFLLHILFLDSHVKAKRFARFE